MKVLVNLLLSIALLSCNPALKYEVEYEKFNEADKSLVVSVDLSQLASRQELNDISNSIKSKFPEAKKIDIDFSSEKYEGGMANYAWATFDPDLEIHSLCHPDLEFNSKR